MKTYTEFITEARRRGSHIDLSPLGKAVIKGTAKLAWKATKAGVKAAGRVVRNYGKTKPEGTKRRKVADVLDKIAPKISPTIKKKREQKAREARASAREARASAREERAAARERRAQEAHERRMNRPTSSSRRPRTSSSPSGRYRNVGAGRRETVSGNR